MMARWNLLLLIVEVFKFSGEIVCSSYLLVELLSLRKFPRRLISKLTLNSFPSFWSLKYGTVYEDLKTDNRSGSFNSDLDPKISQKGTQKGTQKGELKRAAQKKIPTRRTNPVKVTEEGVIFTSYRDGAKVLLTPESTILAQKDYGSDIIIPLDELPSYDTSLEDLRKSVDLTHRWEGRRWVEWSWTLGWGGRGEGF